MTSTADSVWLFDLDGTVIDVNSFPIWVSQMLLGRLPHLGPPARMSISVRCAAAIALRKILRQSHVGFKRRLQRLWTDAAASDIDACASAPLIERLLIHVRPSLHLLLDEVAEGRVDAVLTTAAAEEYALPLARRLGFRHVIATPAGGLDDVPDNVGETKRDRTLAYLNAQGWSARPRMVFTDHADDLPLIRVCTSLVWLGADSEYMAMRRELGGKEALSARAVPGHATHAWVAERTRCGNAACM